MEWKVSGIDVVAIPFLRTYPVHAQVHRVFVQRYLHDRRQDFDVVHAHTPLVPSIRGPWPVVTTVHSLIAQDGKATRIVDARTLLIRMQTVVSARVERDLLRASVAVAVVNPFIASVVREIVGRSVPVRVLPNGVDETIFSPDQTTQRALQALAVGRLVHGKGSDDLLRAWPKVLVRHPTASLVIVGDGPLRLRLERMARLLRISHSVTFVGAVGRCRPGRTLPTRRSAGAAVSPRRHVDRLVGGDGLRNTRRRDRCRRALSPREGERIRSTCRARHSPNHSHRPSATSWADPGGATSRRRWTNFVPSVLHCSRTWRAPTCPYMKRRSTWTPTPAS